MGISRFYERKDEAISTSKRNIGYLKDGYS